MLQVHPAVEAARQLWMGSLHRVMASVCLLPRFNATNSGRPLKFGGEATAWDGEESEEESLEIDDPLKPRTGGTYRVIASQIPQEILDRAHSAIDSESVFLQEVRVIFLLPLFFILLFGCNNKTGGVSSCCCRRRPLTNATRCFLLGFRSNGEGGGLRVQLAALPSSVGR